MNYSLGDLVPEDSQVESERTEVVDSIRPGIYVIQAEIALHQQFSIFAGSLPVRWAQV